MALGNFADDLVLNQTEQPDAPDSIKVTDTILQGAELAAAQWSPTQRSTQPETPYGRGDAYYYFQYRG